MRRALDNWRPERGVPYLNDGIDDPRVLFAIDRGRAAHVTTCRFDAPRVARGDVGPGAHVLARASLPDEGLVVVDDALADAIAPLGARALVVAFVDVERLFAAGVPCDGDGDGDVVVVTRDRARLPTTLRAWPVRERTSLGDGWVRLVLARDGGGR